LADYFSKSMRPWVQTPVTQTHTEWEYPVMKSDVENENWTMWSIKWNSVNETFFSDLGMPGLKEMRLSNQ
jgi:hypothetical protein